MGPGKHGITLTEGSFTGSSLVFANGFSVSVAVLVSGKFADTTVTVGHLGAFDTILVGFADGIKGIDWWTVAWVGHWAITKDQTIAAICPVLALIKIAVVIFHHIDQLRVSLIDISQCLLTLIRSSDAG